MLNDDMLQKINDLINTGVKVPGFGNKVMLDKSKLDGFVKEISELMPQDIQEAKEIINQKNSILAQANMESQRIIESANRESSDITNKSQEEFEQLVDDSSVIEEATKKSESIIQKSKNEAEDIIKIAEQKAENIIDSADQQIMSKKEGADNYSKEVLFDLEERLSEILGQVRRGIDSLNISDIKTPFLAILTISNINFFAFFLLCKQCNTALEITQSILLVFSLIVFFPGVKIS